MSSKIKIAIFASGGGSNAEAIIQHFNDVPEGQIVLVVSNKADAFVLKRAKNHNIPTFVHSKEDVKDGSLLRVIQSYGIDFIVLAGYLNKIGEDLIQAFPKRIVNIHPALLPKYGGRGMYGMNVHKAVAAAGEKESGITIHYVNEHYDEGEVIFQDKVEINQDDSVEDIQQKVLQLEHEHFPKIVEQQIKQL